MSERAREPVRRSGDNLWRPTIGARALYLALALVLGAAYVWLLIDGLSVSQLIFYTAMVATGVVLLPVVLLRWRLVLESDELVRVFVRVRRVPLREVVAAKCVPREGLVFVCADDTELSFGAVGNSAWSHRRDEPTRTDLIARTVLGAAARLREEEPPLDYRLPPIKGFLQAAIEFGIWSAIVGLFVRGD